MQQNVIILCKLWRKDKNLHGCDFVVLPGSFSYGDYLRSGAIARFSPVMDAVIAPERPVDTFLGNTDGIALFESLLGGISQTV